ncbi:MAG: efflux RND transporter periplasmic adaptor subunit [Thermoanaerobaculia bacterium]
MKALGSILLLSLTALSLGGCVKKAAETPQSASTSAELPADVAPLATALAEAHEAAPAATPASSGLATTGEFVAPMTSELVSRQTGQVAAVMAEQGDTVHTGQPLLKLESAYLELEVKRLEAEVGRAAAGLADAERDLARKQELAAKGSVPQATADRSLATRDQLSAAHQAAQAALALAREKLADAVVRSPFDGVVAERRTDVGERLGEATVAFVLMRLKPLRLRFELPERELSRVRRDQLVRARVEPFPQEVFTGKVRIISQTVDPKSRTFVVEAEFPNQDGKLRPGLFARVELEGGSDA